MTLTRDNLPPVWAGPILRRATPERLVVWLAVREPARVRVVLESADGADRAFVLTPGESNRCRCLTAGSHLHYLLIDLPLELPLPLDSWIRYRICLQPLREPAGDWQDCVQKPSDWYYPGQPSLGFQLPSCVGSLLHGSCRATKFMQTRSLARCCMPSTKSLPYSESPTNRWPEENGSESIVRVHSTNTRPGSIAEKPCCTKRGAIIPTRSVLSSWNNCNRSYKHLARKPTTIASTNCYGSTIGIITGPRPPLVVLDSRTHRWRSENAARHPSGLMDWESLTELQQTMLGLPAVLLVSPTPIFGVKLIDNIQQIFTWFGFQLMVDAENWMAHPGSAEAMLNIFRHPKTPPNFVVLSGDVHCSFFYDVELRGTDHGPDIWQICSCALRNEFPPRLLDLLDRANRWLYAPRSPLNWFTRRRRMRIIPRKPEGTPHGRRLLNGCGVGLVEIDHQGVPWRICSRYTKN
jgi:hypothetical protein